MKKGTENILIFGGIAAVAAYFFLGQSATPAVAPPATAAALVPGAPAGYPYPILPGAPTPPVTFDNAYYLQWEYPAMLAANPNVGNPNYQLSPVEAAQYLDNYTDLTQWVTTVIPKNFPSQQSAAQFHWTHNGVPEKRSFRPFLPTDRNNYIPPPANANSSGSGSTLTTALGVAAKVAPLLVLLGDGTLNDTEIAVLMNGSAIGLDLLPYYFSATDGHAASAMGCMEDLLKQYAQ